jgi:hypothetical protein
MTWPKPGSIWTFAAFRASQFKVTAWPRWTVSGVARNVIVGAGGATGVGAGGGGGGAGVGLLHEKANNAERRRNNNTTLFLRDEVIAGASLEFFFIDRGIRTTPVPGSFLIV